MTTITTRPDTYNRASGKNQHHFFSFVLVSFFTIFTGVGGFAAALDFLGGGGASGSLSSSDVSSSSEDP